MANSTVIDWSKSDEMNCKQFRRLDGDLNDKNILVSYAMSIYFSYLFGIVDSADRNFMIDKKKGVFYSVDEENISTIKDSNFTKLKPHFKIIQENWEYIELEISNKLKYWKSKKSSVKEVLSSDIYKSYKNRLRKILSDPKGFFN
jgi:hypothetical protein